MPNWQNAALGPLTAPDNHAAVDLSSTDYTPPAGVTSIREIYVGTGGDVKVDGLTTGSGITYSAVPSGYILHGLFTKIYKTGTGASNLIARW